jgi:hypothetical protein
LVVIFCILYVLISPLPEDDANLSGSSVMMLFVLVTHALLGLLILDVSAARLHSASPTPVVDKTCVRLC